MMSEVKRPQGKHDHICTLAYQRACKLNKQWTCICDETASNWPPESQTDEASKEADGEYEHTILNVLNQWDLAIVENEKPLKKELAEQISNALLNRPKKELDIEAVKDCLIEADLEWHKQPIVDDEANEFFYHMAKKVCQEFAPKKELDIDSCIEYYVNSQGPYPYPYMEEKNRDWAKRFFPRFCQEFALKKELDVEELTDFISAFRARWDGKDKLQYNMKLAKAIADHLNKE